MFLKGTMTTPQNDTPSNLRQTIKSNKPGAVVYCLVSLPLDQTGWASPLSGLRGGRLRCEYCQNKLTKLGPGWL